MAIHSSILACETPWTEEPGGPHSPWGYKQSDMTEHTHTHETQLSSSVKGTLELSYLPHRLYERHISHYM